MLHIRRSPYFVKSFNAKEDEVSTVNILHFVVKNIDLLIPR